MKNFCILFLYVCLSIYICKSENTPVKWKCTIVPVLEGAELTWLLTGCPSSEQMSIGWKGSNFHSKQEGSWWWRVKVWGDRGWVHKGRDTEHHPVLPCFTLGSWQQLCELQLHVLRNGVCSSWGAAKYLSSFLGNGWIHPAPWYFVSEGLESVGVLISLSYTIMLRFHMCWLNESSLSVFHSCCILGLFLLSASWIEKL